MPIQSKIQAAMTGQNGQFTYFQSAKKCLVDVKTWNLRPVVVKHQDDVNGEESARLDKSFSHYEFSAQVYMRDAEVLSKWIEQQEPYDARTQPIDQAGAVRFYPRNGTRRSFVFIDMLWDDFDLNQAGRTDKMMANVTFRFRKLQQAPG